MVMRLRCTRVVGIVIMFFLFLSMIVSNAFAATDNNRLYQNVEYGFSLEIPSHWNAIVEPNEYFDLAENAYEFYYDLNGEPYPMFAIIVVKGTKDQFFSNGLNEYWEYLDSNDTYTFAYTVPNLPDLRMIESQEELERYQNLLMIIEEDLPVILDTFSLAENSVENKNPITTEPPSAPVSNEVNVFGKLIEVNGELVQMEEVPVMVDNRLLIPLRGVLQKLGSQVHWDGQKKQIIITNENNHFILQLNNSTAIINGEKTKMEVPPQLIDSITMVPLRFISEQLGAYVSYKGYPTVEFKSYIDNKDKELQTKYINTLNELEIAEANYKKVKSNYPTFYITGTVRERDPFYVWGVAFSYDADLSHPGFITSNSNIIIKNPDTSQIMYNQYIQGAHYYQRSTFGEGMWGQSVPVHIFGGPPEAVVQAKKKVTILRERLTQIETELIQYINNYYNTKIKKTPSDELYAQHAAALLRASILTENETQADYSLQKINKYIKDFKIKWYFFLHSADIFYQDWNERIAFYKDVGEIDPFILLNFAKTNEQYYFAGVALYELELYDHAIYALKKAVKSSNNDISNLAKKLLRDLGV